jgi:hypothetical protein
MTSSLAVIFSHREALKYNLRVVIAVDYPGIGESTFLAGSSDSTIRMG